LHVERHRGRQYTEKEVALSKPETLCCIFEWLPQTHCRWMSSMVEYSGSSEEDIDEEEDDGGVVTTTRAMMVMTG
jgi:hypothetical protein